MGVDNDPTATAAVLADETARTARLLEADRVALAAEVAEALRKDLSRFRWEVRGLILTVGIIALVALLGA